MSPANIVLEYIKVLIWPVILVSAFTIFSEDLFDIIKNREIEAFGLKVGKQVDDVAINYKAELDALRDQIKKSSNDTALLRKIEVIESGLDKELEQVRNSAMVQQTQAPVITKNQQAKMLEQHGFTAILNRDSAAAIRAFSEAQILWPDYHNVAEIKRLLMDNQKALSNTDNIEVWQKVVTIIFEKYSWGIPADLRKPLATSLP